VAAAAQYLLLGGFTAVAAGISAQGLIGFARDNMALRGPWPYLLFFALDGAAGVCAVLLMRRAARAETALAPRLAVWGLVAASATFNWAHAPPHPAARPAFALMPVIAATLFEFSLHETARRGERTAGQPGRRLPALGWLRPAEQLRIRLQLAADPQLPAAEAAHRVRVAHAARRLHLLRTALAARQRPAHPGLTVRRRARWAERRAQAALSRAGFADPGIAADVLRQLQVRTLTTALARLDYTTPDPAQTILANLITAGPPAPPSPRRRTPKMPNGSRALAHPPQPSHPAVRPGDRPDGNGTLPPDAITGANHSGVDTSGSPLAPHSSDVAGGGGRGGADALVAAAAQIVAAARRDGARLSQAALAAQLRARGYRVANERLHGLAAASGLASRDPGRPK
jgi:Protein of unknown function (DUF2637)